VSTDDDQRSSKQETASPVMVAASDRGGRFRLRCQRLSSHDRTGTGRLIVMMAQNCRRKNVDDGRVIATRHKRSAVERTRRIVSRVREHRDGLRRYPQP
jgi:hypothetical protein